MISRKNRVLYLTAVALAGISLSLGACEKKKKPAPPPPPPPPPAPVLPDPVDVRALMAQLSPDARVQFPERNAPADQSLAEAVILFASDFAKGDDRALAGKMVPDTRSILDTLVSDGSWADETSKIEQVRIVQLNPREQTDVSFATVVMAVQAPGGAYPLAWEGRRQGGSWVFKSVPTENITKPRASDFDTTGVRIGAASIAPEPEPDFDDEDLEEAPDAPETPGMPSMPSGGGGKPGGIGGS
jgi:hypothetical protein